MGWKQWVDYGKMLCLLVLLLICRTPGAIALPVPAQQPLQEIQVHLGTSRGELKFVPDQLEFIAGKRYKLLLDNPSNQKHYFTAKDFADTLWTQKVEAGKVEVKGAIHELELKPGAIAEWILIPQKTGTFELHCTVPGHAAAGMVGTIQVNADPDQA
ncbi:biphenyl 2,3-dioxygenase [Synechococcus moorigangaii CMS01]|nr:biphenyl 2,3-dioxygenase [Synechococcus moorigangaii CMS01]